MVELSLRYKEKVVTAYLWEQYTDDIDEDLIVRDWISCNKLDVGKYIAFDDGSNMLAKIIGVTDEAIRTEVGVFRREDIVHCCIPKFPNTNYSGVMSKEEHYLVRPYSPREKGTATRLLKGEDIPSKFITDRIKMLSLNRMREEADKQGLSEQMLIDIAMKGVQDYKGKNCPFFFKVLARLSEIDIEKPTPQIDPKNGPIFAGIEGSNNNVKTDSNQIVMTNLKTIKTMINGTLDKKNIEEAVVES